MAIGVALCGRHLWLMSHALLPTLRGRTTSPKSRTIRFIVNTLTLYTLLLLVAIEAGLVVGLLTSRSVAFALLNHVWPFAFGLLIASPFLCLAGSVAGMIWGPKGPWVPDPPRLLTTDPSLSGAGTE